jgi:septum site-determining protein MinD
MGRCITVTSGTGGVGKTTTTANLGMALAMTGKNVCLIDADIGLRNLDIILGLENRIVYDLVDVVEGNCRIKQALIRDKHYQNLSLIPAAQTRDKDAVTPEQMADVCRKLTKDFDFVIIDSPAGIEQGFRNAIAGADEVLVVTTPEVSAVRDADRIIGLVEAAEIPPPRLILNRLNPSLVQRGEMMTMEDVQDILAIDLIGIVPEDSTIVMASNRGEPAALSDTSKAGRAYREIAQRLLGEEVPIIIPVANEGFLSRMLNAFRPRQRVAS